MPHPLSRHRKTGTVAPQDATADHEPTHARRPQRQWTRVRCKGRCPAGRSRRSSSQYWRNQAGSADYGSVDFLPVLKGRDSSGQPLGFLFHRQLPCEEDSCCGLTSARQAFYLSAGPAARTLRAALTSRSWTAPPGYVQDRMVSGIDSHSRPQVQ
jgi:hypothetical protein